MAAENARQGASAGLCRGIATASSFVVGVAAWRAAGGVGGGVVLRMLRSVALVPPHPQTLSGPRRLVLTGCISASVFVGTYSLSQWVSSKLAPRTATADDGGEESISDDIANAVAGLMPTLVPEEYMQAFELITKTLTKMDRDLGFLAPFDWPFPIVMAQLRDYTATLPDHGIPTTGKIIEGEACAEAAETGLHWMRFASAAYGNAFMTALGLITPQDLSEAGLELPDFADSELVGLTATAVHTGVTRDDVLFQADNYFDNGLMNPGHLVAVDHSRNAVVLAFRGTSNLDDALTDLVCVAEPFLYGTDGHAGMIGAATALLAQRIELIRGALGQHPTYRLIVTGHSLGGGVALIATILLFHSHPDIAPRVECHAFAPPPVVTLSPDLPKELSDAITVYVRGRDCVPRLSIRSVALLDARLRAVDALPMTLPERLEALAVGPVYMPPEVLHPPMPPAFDTYPVMVLPGATILHVLGENEPDSRRNDLRMELSAWESFQPLNAVGIEMVTEHLPHIYERGFEDLIQVVKSPSDELFDNL
eukprot:m.155220 g.155220  ORF g.155220 m.155220 type:complete len:537 (-) comp14398_c0_seq5:213-1823(-)